MYSMAQPLGMHCAECHMERSPAPPSVPLRKLPYHRRARTMLELLRAPTPTVKTTVRGPTGCERKRPRLPVRKGERIRPHRVLPVPVVVGRTSRHCRCAVLPLLSVCSTTSRRGRTTATQGGDHAQDHQEAGCPLERRRRRARGDRAARSHLLELRFGGRHEQAGKPASGGGARLHPASDRDDDQRA